MTLEFLKWLQLFDRLPLPPMTLDCWRHIDYINKTYMHTLACLVVILLLFNTEKLWRWLYGSIVLCRGGVEAEQARRHNVASERKLTSRRAHAGTKKIVPMVDKGDEDEPRRKSCKSRFLVLMENLFCQTAKDNETMRESSAKDSVYGMDDHSAARKIQQTYMSRKLWLNMYNLRKSLLAKVAEAKGLGKEDFLLVSGL
jgi:hypothetical protein